MITKILDYCKTPEELEILINILTGILNDERKQTNKGDDK